MPKKLEGWTLWNFITSIQWPNVKKMNGDPLVNKNYLKKSHNAEKNWKGGLEPFSLARYCMLREKKEKPF